MTICFRVGAQESLRASLAGQQAAEEKKRQLAGQKFNIKMGPVSLRLGAKLGVAGTDNVRSSATDEKSDLIFRPEIDFLSVWRVTERNSLTLGMGVGYAKYLRTTEFDNFIVTPGSDLSFDLYVGDFVINLHDRFLYSQDVSTDPTASGVGSLSRFENTIGQNTIWDLNKVVLSLSYDHQTYLVTDPAFDYQTHSSELVAVRAGYRVLPTMQLGLEVGGGLTDYDEPVLADNKHLAIGPFVATALSEYTFLRVSAGYVTYYLDSSSLTNASSTNAVTNSLSGSTSGIYADLSLSQRTGGLIRQHALSVGRQIQSGTFANTFDEIYVRHTAEWRLFRKTGLSTTISYEHVTDSGDLVGNPGETLDRYGFGLTLSRPLTRRTSAGLSYQFYLKTSDQKSREYMQNRLELNAAYTF